MVSGADLRVLGEVMNIADKIDMNLKFSSPGFYLSNDDLREIVRGLRRVEALEAALREIADAPAWGAPD